jgi:hypothetical protein
MIKPLFIFLFFLTVLGFSQTGLARPESFGSIAGTVFELASNASEIIKVFCGMIGVGMLTASLLAYKAHRDNPDVVSWLKPIGLMIGGLAFLAIAFLPRMFV